MDLGRKSTRCSISASFDENKGHINLGIEEKIQHPHGIDHVQTLELQAMQKEKDQLLETKV
jgi:hypothetical protein